jgi:hypothetical protein
LVNARLPRGLALLLACAAAAQEKLTVVGPEPALLRLGDVARVDLRIDDPQGELREIAVPRVDGLRVRVTGPSRLTEQSIVGGRIAQRITATWHVELQPTREGAFVVPPFPVWTGSREQQTRELRLDVQRDLRGADLGHLEVTVAPTRVYVHEPIRIRVEAAVQQAVRLAQEQASNGQAYWALEVQASWLREFPGAEPIELPRPVGELAAVVDNGKLALSTVDAADRDGRRWTRFRFDRAFLPTRAGTIELSAPSMRFHVLTRDGGRDVFGLPRRGATEQYFVTGKPLTIEVLPIPEKGRPTPYYGAVGRFAIEAALDRDSVKQGGSVKLTLTVTGEGNLEFLRLPPVDALPGFHKLGQAETARDANKVAVTYDLLVAGADVREVPPIEWNWFDTTPGVERFVTAATKALPLTVLPLANGESLPPLPDDVRAVTPGVDDVFDLPALDGAPRRLARPHAWQQWLAALAPWAVALLGALAFRRWRARAADVTGQRARQAARTCRRALANGTEPLDALAGYLGDRLGVAAAAVIAPDLAARLVAAGLAAADAASVAAAIERGTAARYGGGAPLTATDVEQQLARLERTRFGVASVFPVLLALAAIAAAPSRARAQQPDLDAAVAAYRARDYAVADAAFARAFTATGDRRLLQARGNCAFRQGDLPRALWAYESARLALPRDPELLANVRLVRARLGVPEQEQGLVAQLTGARGALTPAEQLGLGGMCMVLAAASFVLGWHRPAARWVGGLLLLPGLLWTAVPAIAGTAAPAAIALQPLQLTSEPRAGLEPVATVRPGVAVELLGGSDGSFVRVRAGERVGYAARELVAVIE